MYDTLHEALDVDGLRSLLVAMECGEVTVHTVDTTEPSVLAHEILTARPYAFLDDEELQNRRTNAVTLRRGLSVDLASIGQLEAAAIEQVHEEITPRPETGDDLHDLLSSLVVTMPRPDWQGLWEELRDRGRVREIEHVRNVVVVHHRDVRRCHAGVPRRRRRDHGDGARAPRARRHHHGSDGVAWPRAGWRPSRVALPNAIRKQQALGFSQQRGERRRVGLGGLTACMRLFARCIRRESAQPATAQDLMRFLLRWQHLAPGTQLAGDAGLATVVGQLEGWEAAASAWEPELYSRRLRAYDAAGSTGSATTARSRGSA